MNLLTVASPEGRLAAAEFQRIVDKYDLRWEPEPHRRYPVGEVTWPPAGWLPLVEQLIRRLIASGWDRNLAKVKSKFGALRFYIGEGTDEMFDAIDHAKEVSLRTCGVCGRPGQQREEVGTAVRCAHHQEPGGKPSPLRLAASYRAFVPRKDGNK